MTEECRHEKMLRYSYSNCMECGRNINTNKLCADAIRKDKKELKKKIEQLYDNLIEKVWKETAKKESQIKDVPKGRWYNRDVKVRKSEIFGRKSVQLDIEDSKKEINRIFNESKEAKE